MKSREKQREGMWSRKTKAQREATRNGSQKPSRRVERERERRENVLLGLEFGGQADDESKSTWKVEQKTIKSKNSTSYCFCISGGKTEKWQHR